jgi:hypothetical protein
MSAQTKWIIAVCVAIAVLTTGAAAYYFKYIGGGPDPAKMSSEQIRTYVQSPDFNNMPRAQRRVFFEKVMDSRMQGYFNTPLQERDNYLDKIIDDMQNFRPNFDRQRFRDPNRDPNRMQQMQQRFRNATPQQRRLREEMRDPVKDQMRRKYYRALRTRAEARGIQMGGRGPGGGGGRP